MGTGVQYGIPRCSSGLLVRKHGTFVAGPSSVPLDSSALRAQRQTGREGVTWS